MSLLATNTSAFHLPGPEGWILSITRAPSSFVPLPCCDLACCLAEALTTRPHNPPPHGAMTISIAPFFQRPSSPLLASADAGAEVARTAASAMRQRFMPHL